MCGIVGYVGTRPAAPIVMDGLQRLEYRGYDSAGMAVAAADGTVQIRREVGKLANLARLLERSPADGTVAIGHTRWATHGPPTQINAHPHCSPDGRFLVVQNGIVENFAALRSQLQSEGYSFRSETDTEVIVHLVHRYYLNGCRGDLVLSVRRALQDLKGPSAVVVMSTDNPDVLVAARLGNAGGVAIGLGEDETFVASDITALLRHTRRVVYLGNRQMAVIRRNQVLYYDFDGRELDVQPTTIELDAVAAEKGEYAHFMQKEIYEQGRTITDTLRGRIDYLRNRIQLESLKLNRERLRAIDKVTIVACGTSYYAALVGKTLIERLARIPVEIDYASEFRYRDPIVRPSHLVLAITQSGETADTLAALDEARAKGAYIASIVNVAGSQAAQVSNGVLYMQAGPEIGVASTKAFTSSVTDLFLLALYLGQERGMIADRQLAALIHDLSRLPGLAGELLESAWQSGFYAEVAREYSQFHNFLYLGRGINYPIAREGALKLKEISYIHAEGYPAGEMKHGPIALIDAQMPTVVVAPKDSVHDKMISQIEQVKARGGRVLAVAHGDDPLVRSKADVVMQIPVVHELLTPVLAVMPLQLLAYEVAVCRGTDVDQPRNLAKSVTVE